MIRKRLNKKEQTSYGMNKTYHECYMNSYKQVENKYGKILYAPKIYGLIYSFNKTERNYLYIDKDLKQLNKEIKKRKTNSPLSVQHILLRDEKMIFNFLTGKYNLQNQDTVMWEDDVRLMFSEESNMLMDAYLQKLKIPYEFTHGGRMITEKKKRGKKHDRHQKQTNRRRRS